MENLNLFDIVVITLVTLLGLKGLFKGFIKEFFGLVGIVGGVFIASRVATDVGYFANSIIPIENENTLLLVGFVLSIVFFWIVAYILGVIISKVFVLSGLGIMDKFFGFVFGSGKIFLLFSIIAYATTNVKIVNDALQPKLKDSIVFPILTQAGGYILKFDSSSFQNTATKEMETIIDSAKETISDITQQEISKQVSAKIDEIKDDAKDTK